MRIWKNARGDLISDEQVLAYLASCGSLGKAFASGDVCLVTEAKDARSRADGNVVARPTPRRLADYLAEGDC